MRINVQEKVKEILLDKPNTKDNDFYLMYWVWKEEFDNLPFLAKQDLKVDFDKTNIINLLSMLKDKHLSHPSGIMRSRRKLQEEHPKLRGSVWNVRHLEEENVKAALGYRPREAQ